MTCGSQCSLEEWANITFLQVTLSYLKAIKNVLNKKLKEPSSDNHITISDEGFTDDLIFEAVKQFEALHQLLEILLETYFLKLIPVNSLLGCNILMFYSWCVSFWMRQTAAN